MTELAGSVRPVWSTVLIACIPLMPALLGIVFYQVVNNEKQSSAIMTNAVAIRVLTDAIFSLNTPLSQKVLKLEDRADNFARVETDLNRRIDTLDTSGSRALALVASNQQRVITQVDRLADRVLLLDMKLAEANNSLRALMEQTNRQQAQIDGTLDFLGKKYPAKSRRSSGITLPENYNLQGGTKSYVPR